MNNLDKAIWEMENEYFKKLERMLKVISAAEEGDACPSCDNGTLEFSKKEVRCNRRRECGLRVKRSALNKGP